MPNLAPLEDEVVKALEKKIVMTERQTTAILQKALKEIRGEMATFYTKYSKGGILTKVEMTQYNRYVTLEKHILGILNEATNKIKSSMKRIPGNVYEEGFFRTAWAMDQATELSLSWGILNKEAIVETLANDFFLISLDKYGPAARNAVKTAIAHGLSLGKSFIQMSKDLAKALSLANYEALRIIRTEGMSALNAAMNDIYLLSKEQGVEGNMVWDATLDAKTRPVHGAADGIFKKKDGYFHLPDGDKGQYPGSFELSAANRVHCRCRERFQILGYSPALRRAKEEGIIPYQNYMDWIKNYGPKIKGKTITQSHIRAQVLAAKSKRRV